MAILQSDTAVNYANQVMNLVQQLANIRASIANIIAINTVNPLGNFWNVLNTTALNADGTLGTADASGTPVSSHPIDSRQYPNLSRVVKATDLSNALQILVDENTFFAGTQVSANGARPAQINTVAM